jgi:hypothetical protein
MPHLKVPMVKRLPLAFVNRHRPRKADWQLGESANHVMGDLARSGVVLITDVIPFVRFN